MDAGDIFTFLIIAIPVGAAIIDKVLKSAGKTGPGKSVFGPAEVFPEIEPDATETTRADYDGKSSSVSYDYVPDVVPDRNVSHSPKVQELLSGGYKSIGEMLRDKQQSAFGKSVSKEHSVRASAPAEGKGLYVDKKNLVIYSEIMKPKYME